MSSQPYTMKVQLYEDDKLWTTSSLHKHSINQACTSHFPKWSWTCRNSLGYNINMAKSLVARQRHTTQENPTFKFPGTCFMEPKRMRPSLFPCLKKLVFPTSLTWRQHAPDFDLQTGIPWRCWWWGNWYPLDSKPNHTVESSYSS